MYMVLLLYIPYRYKLWSILLNEFFKNVLVIVYKAHWLETSNQLRIYMHAYYMYVARYNNNKIAIQH